MRRFQRWSSIFAIPLSLLANLFSVSVLCSAMDMKSSCMRKPFQGHRWSVDQQPVTKLIRRMGIVDSQLYRIWMPTFVVFTRKLFQDRCWSANHQLAIQTKCTLYISLIYHKKIRILNDCWGHLKVEVGLNSAAITSKTRTVVDSAYSA